MRALSDLAKRRRFGNVLDLGCGTGLLAIGAAKLWRRKVLASDIDVVAVEVTRENARANGEAPLVRALTADGLTHPALAAKAPYDLIVANILAGPLTRLAPAIARALAPGGVALLSGLLRWQENLVLGFYRPQGLILRGARRRRRRGRRSCLRGRSRKAKVARPFECRPWTRPLPSRPSTTVPTPRPARRGLPPFAPNWPGAASTASSCRIPTSTRANICPSATSGWHG